MSGESTGIRVCAGFDEVIACGDTNSDLMFGWDMIAAGEYNRVPN